MIRRFNVVLLWIASLGLASVFMKLGTQGTFGQDSHAYWLALQGGELYRAGPTELDAYLYSPLFTQLLTPLGLLPWPAFQGVWLAAGIAATVWLVKPLPLKWAVPVALVATTDLVIGNIYIFLAVMIALSPRSPVVWIFGILTKVTPGVGLLWVLARREYSSVLRATGLLVVVTAGSWALAPGDWADWIELLTSTESGDPTFLLRCVVAIGIVFWAAHRHPAWLAVAVTVATPVFNAAACLVPLLAIPRLTEAARQGRLSRASEPATMSTSRGSR